MSVLSVIFMFLSVILLSWFLERAVYTLFGQKPFSSGKLLFVLFGSIFFAKLAIYISWQADAASAIFGSVIHALQTFSLDESTDDFVEAIMVNAGEDCSIYWIEAYFYFLGFIAPISGGAFLLDILMDFFPMLRFAWYKIFSKELYIFSELNERSIALAENIYNGEEKITEDDEKEENGSGKEKHKSLKNSKCRFVFTDVYDDNAEKTTELIERAKCLKSVLLKKDILTIWGNDNGSIERRSLSKDREFKEKQEEKSRKKSKQIYLYVIGSNESENIKHAMKLIDYFRNYKNVSLYVFSERSECEVLLENKDSGVMKVRKTDVINSAVWNHINSCGYDYFFSPYKYKFDETTCEIEKFEKELKEISVAIVGLGKHGKEMLETLVWYCQMPGYHITINAYDAKQGKKDELLREIPDIVTKNYYGYGTPGDARYDVYIYDGMDINNLSTLNSISDSGSLKYVFVSLGDDEKNIAASMSLRSFLLKSGMKPVIDTIVYDSDEGRTLSGIKKMGKGGCEYDINCFGSLKSIYSMENIDNRELNEEAMDINSAWIVKNKEMEKEKKQGMKEEADCNYWKYSYYRKSSIASAMHRHLRDKMCLPYEEKPEPENGELTNIEKIECITEHRRWNAYMRSQGYTYSGSKDRCTRNDLMRVHNLLVPYDELPEDEKRKDV